MDRTPVVILFLGYALCVASVKVYEWLPPRQSAPIQSGGRVVRVSKCNPATEDFFEGRLCYEDCTDGYVCIPKFCGCKCKIGLRRKGSECVRNCPSDRKCKDTMVLSDCPHCVERCDPFDNTVQPRCDIGASKPNVICESERKYCTCPRGWKWQQGKCITECLADRCSRDGLVYKSCYHHGLQTCEGKINPNKMKGFSKIVCYSACFCPDGLVLIKGVCLSPNFCPVGGTENKCKNGFEFTESANPCTRSCQGVLSHSCPPMIYKGCLCKYGTFWNGKACVPQDRCFKKIISRNVTKYKCGQAHLMKCTEVDEKFRFRQPAPIKIPLSKTITRGCHCTEGFFSDGQGYCVTVDQCPIFKCPRNSSWKMKCSDWDLCYPDIAKLQKCIPVHACYCDNKFKRLSDTPVGNCIPEKKCVARP